MISIVCYQWNIGYRDYSPQRVNILANMLERKMSIPYRFICVVDKKEKGFSDKVELIELPPSADFTKELKSPEGKDFPSSYRRLWSFSEEAKILGDRIMMMDIDCIICDDLAPLFEIEGNFVGWNPNFKWGHGKRIAGGTWIHNTGTHKEVWKKLNKHEIRKAREKGWRGSDQAFLSHMLINKCNFFPEDAGIFQAQDMKRNAWAKKPEGARIIHFNGHKKPWMFSNDWIRRAYR